MNYKRLHLITRLLRKLTFVSAVSYFLLTQAFAEEQTPDVNEFAPPSCVKLCLKEKSGKARRSCPSSCLAMRAACEEQNGLFEFQRNRYVCFENYHKGVAINEG